MRKDTLPAEVIAELLARGRKAYVEHLAKLYTPETMPMGVESLNIVTRGDFVKHADLCLDFIGDKRSLHVLNHDGSIKALLCRHHVLSIIPR